MVDRTQIIDTILLPAMLFLIFAFLLEIYIGILTGPPSLYVISLMLVAFILLLVPVH